MKKTTIFVIGVTLLLFFLGCTIPETPTEGSLSLTINNGIKAKTLVPDLDINPASYRIIGSGPQGSVFDENTTGTEVTIDYLRFGSWKINIEAFNAEGVLIATGKAEAAVHVEDATPVAITISLLDGMGALHLDVSWPVNEVENPAVSGSLKSSSGDTIDLVFSDANSSTDTIRQKSVTGNTVPAGYHTLVVTIHDRGVSGNGTHQALGAVEIVRILKDQTTYGNYNLQGIPGMGNIDVRIEQDFNDPIEVSIQSSDNNLTLPKSVDFESATTFEVSAIIPADDEDALNITYVWYLNGESVGVDRNYTIDLENSPLSTSIDGKFAPGHYRLDVTAFNADSSRAGSAHFEFDVTGNPIKIVAEIPDLALEARIRQEIDKPEGPIYNTDLENIRYLDIQGGWDYKISDLTGLEYCVNMNYLNISYNELTNISPIARMKNLETLHMTYNNLSNLNSLRGLTKLRILNASINNLTDISSLEYLTTIEDLDLSSNKNIADFTPIAHLTKMVSLNLGYSDFTDSTLLAGMASLQILAVAGNPGLSNISGLAGKTELWHLLMEGCSISDFTPFSTMPKVKSLYLSDNNITDISRLAHIPQAEMLILSGNRINDLSPVMGLKNLKSLSADDNAISDISCLENNPSIISLQLDNNSIQDISPLAAMPNLKRAYVNDNNMIIKNDGGQGTVNLNVITTLEARNTTINYTQGNILE